jgi:hypothetical protein
MKEVCAYCPELRETLGSLKADTGWLKKAFWSIPAMIVMVSMAIGGYVISMEKRISVCETQIANQLSLGDMPRWTETSPKSKQRK